MTSYLYTFLGVSNFQLLFETKEKKKKGTPVKVLTKRKFIIRIDSQWELDVCLRKLKQGLCINLEGWDREEDGREVQKGGDICIPVAGSC